MGVHKELKTGLKKNIVSRAYIPTSLKDDRHWQTTCRSTLQWTSAAASVCSLLDILALHEKHCPFVGHRHLSTCTKFHGIYKLAKAKEGMRSNKPFLSVGHQSRCYCQQKYRFVWSLINGLEVLLPHLWAENFAKMLKACAIRWYNTTFLRKVPFHAYNGQHGQWLSLTPFPLYKFPY